MAEIHVYLWTSQDGRPYVRLVKHDGYWRVEWGRRDPPGGDYYLAQGHRVISDREEAVRLAISLIQAFRPDSDVVATAERGLRAALAGNAVGTDRGRDE